MEFQKILITAPTSSAKSYCDEAWIDNTLLTNYPNFKIVVFDNTEDSGEYVDKLNNYYKSKYNGDQFLAIKSDTTFCDGVISRICKSHNDCRDYAIDNGFDGMLHLETDVFLKPHYLQELVLHKKPVIGALYYRDEGRFRKLMVQQRVNRSPHNVFIKNFAPEDDIYFVDGTVQQASHIGLGCVLINIKVLKKFQFRIDPRVHAHADSFFAEDCFQNKIKIFADTSLICEHRNANWFLDVFAKEKKEKL
jgi:hypothetical protein